MMRTLTPLIIATLLAGGATMAAENGLLAHWPLQTDCRDHSGNANHGTNHGVTFARGAAHFDGREASIEVADPPSLSLADGDLTIAAWVRTDEVLDDVIGDILSKYDPAARRGVNLGVVTHAGMTSSQSNA
ncbi:MAG: hypothetical protein GF393_07735, partial [Armatimonadia bacterium]|nr:hypothetical protein [Armatimonadia bacterium]